MTQLSTILAVFDELPSDTSVTITRWDDGKGWTCELRRDRYKAIGTNEQFEKAIARALVNFYAIEKVRL